MQLNGKDAGKDIPKVRGALSNLRIININSSSELNSWFEEQKADISKSRLKDLIMGDFDKWYSENKIATELNIGINSDLNLKYTVDDETVPAFVNGFMLTQCEVVSQSNNVEKVVIKHDSIYKGRDILATIGALKFFNKSLIQNSTKTTVLLAIRPTFTIGEKEDEPSFANEIRNLGLENDLIHTTELTAENGFVLGWNIWLACALALLLLVFLFYFVKMTILPYKIKNIVVSVTNIGNNKKYEYTFKNCQSHLFGKKGTILDQASFVIEIYGRRGFPILMPRAIMFTVQDNPDNNLTILKDDVIIEKTPLKIKVGDSIQVSHGIITFKFTVK